MERHDVLAMMTALKLAGMRAAYDDILADGLKRRHPVQQIIGTLLQTEVTDKKARSIKYQMTSARLPTATHFLIRRCSDRFAGDGSLTVESIMAEEKVRGVHSVAVRDDKGKSGSTQVELSYRRMTILPPIAKRKRYPALTLTVLHAREPEEPVGRPRIDWKLITDLPVESHADAVEKLHWYAMRWKIEVFHKILKSGCRAEQARLRTAERLVRLLAVFCILSWRVFWLTMLNRIKPDLEASLVLTELETSILDRLIPDPTAHSFPAGTLSRYLIKITRLGGYLARAKDPPPGNIVMWRGLSRLSDIALGATLQGNDVGN